MRFHCYALTEQGDQLTHNIDASTAPEAAEYASRKFKTDATWTVVRVADGTGPMPVKVSARTTYHAEGHDPHDTQTWVVGTPGGSAGSARGPHDTQVIATGGMADTLPGGLRTNEAR
jgi:hypothetical protein